LGFPQSPAPDALVSLAHRILQGMLLFVTPLAESPVDFLSGDALGFPAHTLGDVLVTRTAEGAAATSEKNSRKQADGPISDCLFSSRLFYWITELRLPAFPNETSKTKHAPSQLIRNAELGELLRFALRECFGV
jgi:hypothetical protein